MRPVNPRSLGIEWNTPRSRRSQRPGRCHHLPIDVLREVGAGQVVGVDVADDVATAQPGRHVPRMAITEELRIDRCGSRRGVRISNVRRTRREPSCPYRRASCSRGGRTRGWDGRHSRPGSAAASALRWCRRPMQTVKNERLGAGLAAILAVVNEFHSGIPLAEIRAKPRVLRSLKRLCRQKIGEATASRLPKLILISG